MLYEVITQAGDDKGRDKKGIQEGQIAQSWQVVADSEIEGDEQ